MASIAAVFASIMACSSGFPDVAESTDDSGAPLDDTGVTSLESENDLARDSARLDDATIPDSGATDSSVASDAVSGGDSVTSDVLVATLCTISITGEAVGCTADQYCDAPTCESGTCRKRPTPLLIFLPICGCDGVTYWNDHYAGSLGRSTRTASGQCGGGVSITKTCGGVASRACPTTDQICVIEGTGPATCTLVSPSGLCWAIPTAATCVGASGAKKERVCSATGACLSRCDATKAGDTFFDDDGC